MKFKTKIIIAIIAVLVLAVLLAAKAFWYVLVTVVEYGIVAIILAIIIYFVGKWQYKRWRKNRNK